MDMDGAHAVRNEEPEMEEAWSGRRPPVDAQGCRPTRQSACRGNSTGTLGHSRDPGDLVGRAQCPWHPPSSPHLCNGPVAWWGTRNPQEDERAAPWTLLPSLWGLHSGSHLTAFPTGRLVTLAGEVSSLTQSPVLWVPGGLAGTRGLRGAHGSCASTGGHTRSVQPQVREPQLNWPGAGVHGHTCKH